MNIKVEDEISKLELSRLSARDFDILARVQLGSPALENLVEKVGQVFAYLAKHDIKDDFDVAMLGVKLNYSLPPSSWQEIVKMISARYGKNAAALLTLRVENNTISHDAASDQARIGASNARALFHALVDSIREGNLVAPLAAQLVQTASQLDKFVGSEISEDGFIGDLVLALAALGKRRKPSREKQETESVARQNCTHFLSSLAIKWAPQQQIGWSFLASAYEYEHAFEEAELVRFHNVQTFDTSVDWDGLLMLVGRLEGRIADSWSLGLQGLIRFPKNFGLLINTIRAGLRNNSFEDDFPILSELSVRVLSSEAPRKDLSNIPTGLFATIHIKAIEHHLNCVDAIQIGSSDFVELYDNKDLLRFWARHFSAGVSFLKISLSGLRRTRPDKYTNELDDIYNFSLAFGSYEERLQARDAGYLAISRGLEIAATRRWLAQIEVKLDEDGALAKAEQLLRDNIVKFEDEESRVLLKELLGGFLIEFQNGIESKQVRADPSRLKGVGDAHTKTTLFTQETFAKTLWPLAADVQEIGALKKAELNTDSPSHVLNAIRSIEPKTVPGKAQFELLEARYGDASRQQDVSSFAAKFEYALRLGDLALLSRVQEGMPKLTALTLVAKSLFGDKDASALLLTFFANEGVLARTDQLLIQRLKKRISTVLLRHPHDVAQLTEMLQAIERDCIVYLRDANEMHSRRVA